MAANIQRESTPSPPAGDTLPAMDALRSLVQGIIVTDVSGRILLVNPVAEILIGWPQSEAQGRPLEEVFHLVHETTRARYDGLAEKILQSSGFLSLGPNTLLLGRESGERLVTVSGAPVRDTAGRITGVVLGMQEVLEQELSELAETDATAGQIRGRLVASIAHDFNNFLAIILGNLTLSKMLLYADSEVYHRLEEAGRAAERAKALTKKLLALSEGNIPGTPSSESLPHLPPTDESGSSKPDDVADLQGQGRVLVMDDEEGMRGVTEGMLRQLGYAPELAADGEDAIRQYQEAQAQGRRFAFVILDLTVARGLGGQETILRLLEIDPAVRAILSSGYLNLPVMTKFRDLGFKETLPKPYSIEDLGRVLRKAAAAAS